MVTVRFQWLIKDLFTWSGGSRSSGVGFFCFHALGDTKQKKLTPLDRGPPLHVNRVLIAENKEPFVLKVVRPSAKECVEVSSESNV